jgi:hypothetical protein
MRDEIAEAQNEVKGMFEVLLYNFLNEKKRKGPSSFQYASELII